jgi:hypothetical protein
MNGLNALTGCSFLLVPRRSAADAAAVFMLAKDKGIETIANGYWLSRSPWA